MDTSTRRVIFVLLLLIFSFEITNVVVSNTDLSGNAVVDENKTLPRRSIRLGSVVDFGLMYPFVITFQDLILLLSAGFLLVVLILDNRDVNLKGKASKKRLLAAALSTVVFYILLNLQYAYRFSSKLFNQWSFYYLFHFCFMVSLMFLFALSYAYGKKKKIHFVKNPNLQFILLVVSLLLVGLLIGFFDSFYTGGIVVKQLDNPFFYFIVMLSLALFTIISSISFASLPNVVKMKDKNFLYYLFLYFVTYATGLWFLSWHFMTGSLLPSLQHPLPFRIYPFAIYWESWMDHWLMVVSIVVLLVASYMIYKKIKR
ncbi:MAG: hypothetical protein J7K73_03250 [Nanoarchaeota archaeon]|nr:hypothetical protein [Nanoarchaeota archaeon]